MADDPDGRDPRGLAREREGLDELVSLTYEELRRLAAAVNKDDARATLNPTALVNEAWVKLASSPPVCATTRLHFKRIAARAMRQVLVESARRRATRKRGEGRTPIHFDEELQQAAAGAHELLALDAALAQLARMSPRQAAMIEARFFGGLDVAECATLLEVSEATVLRDWRVAKAWLARELRAAE